MPSKPKWSQVKLTQEGRSKLRSAIRLHPSATQFVKTGSQISKLNKVGLLNLAVSLGIDPMAVLQAPEIQETPSWSNAPFSGTVEFDFSMSFLGKSVIRRARMKYSHTPDWAYFDATTCKEVLPTGEGGSYSFELQSVAEGEIHYTGEDIVLRGRTIRKQHETDWEPCNELTELGIWTDEMWDAVIALIDEQCRATDAANREAAAISAR